MKSAFITAWLTSLLVLSLSPGVRADDASEFFEKRVRPLLAERCWDCHASDEPDGELRLDSLSEMLAGGSRGPAIVPGKPEQSLLISAINHADTLTMPPKTKLKPAEIAVFTAWVKAGAVWPNSPTGLIKTKPLKDSVEPKISPEQQSFWAFQPLSKSPLPSVQNLDWCRSPIDRFVLAELEAAGMQPAPLASPRSLIRRLTFDLTGLPPTAEEVDEFERDCGSATERATSSQAYVRLIDRLLASPHYGERWGRHWLDLARYGDSNGLDENIAHANAWRYRDYVIAAFNDDLPYDDFVREQLAGDLLPLIGDPSSPENARLTARRLTATGFLVLGGKMLAEDDPVKMQMDIVDEQVDTLGRAFLGMTLGCARCHDHKFDPLSMADYYGLAGIFKSTKTMETLGVVARWQERPLASPDDLARRLAHQQQIDAQQAVLTQLVERSTQQLVDAARANSGAYVRAAAKQWWLDRMQTEASSFGAAITAGGARRADVQVIEAEHYQRGTAIKHLTGYGEGIGVILNGGTLPNVAEYDVTLAQAGPHQIEIRYAAADQRPVVLSVNGQVWRKDAIGKVTGSWNPDGQRWEVQGIVPLKAGLNVVRLERAGPFPHIDKLLLAPLSNSPVLPQEVFAEQPTDAAIVTAFVAGWLKFLQREADNPQTSLTAWRDFQKRLQPSALASGESPATTKNAPTTAATAHWATPEVAAEFTRVVAELSREFTAALPKSEISNVRSQIELQPAEAERLTALRNLLIDAKTGPFAAPVNAEDAFALDIKAVLVKQRADLDQLKQSMPKFSEVMAVSEGQIADLALHLRGNHTTLGAVVPRRFPRIMTATVPASFDTSIKPENAPASAPVVPVSGRRELAEWLTHPEHPLTSRVIVNRLWQGHFGEGLVRSPDNFGLLGERPTHPQLLDWLAQKLVASGWSLKDLHREIVLSATYQMSARYDAANFERDPDQRLLWRHARRRLEAEAIRDSVLAVSGSLEQSMGGSLLPTPNRQYVTSTANVNPKIYNSQRRSVYLPIVRSAVYEVLQAFDFADPTVLNGKRDATTVAPQALFMLNSEIVSESSRRLAEQLQASPGLDNAARVREAFRRILSRSPSPSEVERATAFVQSATASSSDADTLRAWQGLCRTLLASNEFLYVE